MDTVTYPDPQVADTLANGFSPLKINLFDRHPDFKEASAGARIPWAPALIFSDASGRELRRFIGWLPPQSFLAELLLVQGIHGVGQGQFDEATQSLTRIETEFSESEVAAEGLYWQGIARFLAGSKDMAALQGCWQRLVETHPGSRFATHASVIEDLP